VPWRWLGVALLGAVVAGLALWWALRPAAKTDALRWGADEEGGEPYLFKDPGQAGQLAGFEVDLKEALAREVSRPIEFRHYEFKSLIAGLRRGDIDFAMNGVEILPDRRELVRFSRPYYVYKLQLAVRKDEDRFTDLKDLPDRRDVTIGTLESSAAAQVLERKAIPFRSYSSQADLYKDLRDGALDGVYIDRLIHDQFLPDYRGKLRLTGQPGEKGYYGLAFRKEDEALAAEFDAALDRLIQSGELEKIYKKWNIWNEDQNELGQPPDLAGAEASEPAWTWGRYLPLLLHGAWVTVAISVAGMLLAVTLGMPIALARLYGPLPLRFLATCYVEFFRGIPVLLLIYFLYYGLPVIGQHYGLGLSLKLSPLVAAVLGFGINYAAYEAEIYRAGIGAVSHGQWEAAASLGMSGSLTFRRIILPQAFRVILPPMTNDFVALFKDTSVVSIIAVTELSKQYQILANSPEKRINHLEIALVTAALYLIMSVPLGYLSRYLEKRWARTGSEG
jgi:polar amino acid transport system substrate-binding protein